MTYLRVPFKSGQWWVMQLQGKDMNRNEQKSTVWHLGFLNSPRRADVLAWVNARPEIASYKYTRLALARRFATFSVGATLRDSMMYSRMFYEEISRSMGVPMLSAQERRRLTLELGYPVR